MTRPGRGDVAPLLFLLAMPVLAHAPAWGEGRLLGPDDGFALHYPLRALVWEAFRSGELPSWNPGIFLGTPLLAAYRPGAFFPLMPPLSALPPFLAFQVLVLVSLALAGTLTHLYLRRLGAGRVGAYVGGLSFCLGPYLVGHLGDTATVVAAPLLPLVLLAAESHMNRRGAARAAGLAGAVALLLLAGSSEATRAGAALLAGRLLLGHLARRQGGPSLRATAGALAAGAALAAPQLLPTLLAALDAGRSLTGLASQVQPLPGATGLVLRYVSHTPAPALALAALPLTLSHPAVRVHAAALALTVGLQWGRGPLAGAGALPLVFDFALATLGGLSLSAQWLARREPLGRRLRRHFLVAALASALALSVAAAMLGPLPQGLTGPVGVLAVAFVLYFSLAGSANLVKAGVWLVPLTAAFALQPQGRRVWDEAPTRAELESGTATRQAVDRSLAGPRPERILSLVRAWPHAEQHDLAYGNLGLLSGRLGANGYDPMVPLRTRQALGAMGVGGALPGAFFRTPPPRLERLGVRWVQIPASALLLSETHEWGLGDPLDVTVEAGQPRSFPVPIVPATEIRLASSLADSVAVPQDEVVAWVEVRLASGRSLSLPLRAGVHTAEWAWDRPDVRPRVAHARAHVLESWVGLGGGFAGHRYGGIVALPGRYRVESLRFLRSEGPGRLQVHRLGLFDAGSRRITPVSLVSGYVSDASRFRETVSTPRVRLLELPGTLGRAWVVGGLRVLTDEASVLRALGAPATPPAREVALATEEDARGLTLPAGSRSSRAEVTRLRGGRVDVRAEGPGLLVVTSAWDRGWRASLDGQPARLLRVNHALLGVALGEGRHRLTLRYSPPGLRPGLGLCAAGAAGLLAWALRDRRARRAGAAAV